MSMRCDIPMKKKKRKKLCIFKLLSLLMIFCIMMPVLTTGVVFAEEAHVISASGKNIIEAENFSNKTENASEAQNFYRAYTSNNNKYANYGCIAFSAHRKMSLKYYLNVKEEGIYRLMMYMGGAGKKAYAISVDNEVVAKPAFNAADSVVTENRAGDISLTAGEHYLNIDAVTADETYVFFYYLTLEKVVSDDGFKKESGSYREAYIPGIIQAEDFDLGADGSYGNVEEIATSDYRTDSLVRILSPNIGQYTIMLSKGEFVNYTFIAETDDLYTLSVATDNKAEMLLYLDDAEKPLSIQPSGNSKSAESKVAALYITKGEHKFRIEPKEADISFDYFRISSGDSYTGTVDKSDDQGAEIGALHNVYQELYVAETGSDESGNGTLEKPFRSIGRAKEEVAKINMAMTGDIVVYILPGSYKLEETEVFGTEHGGRNGYNVIFRGANILNPPMIHGGVEITSWEKYNDAIWSAPLSGVEYVRNLYVNGFPATRSRSKYIYQAIDNYVAPGSNYSKDGIVFSARNFPASFAHPEDMELVLNNKWDHYRAPVKEFIKRETDAVLVCDPDAINYVSATSKGCSFYIENAMELLDEPGEFYYCSSEQRIYYYPYQEEDMTAAETYVADTELLFDIRGASDTNRIQNLIFDNLKIYYGAYDFASRYGYIGTQSDGLGNLDAATFKDGAFFAGQITVNNADGFVIRNCELACHGSAVINMDHSVSNSKIEGSIIRDAAGTGIKIGSPRHYMERDGIDVCRNITIENNVIQRVAAEFLNNCALSVYYEKDISILHNYIADVPYSGMSIGWGWASGEGYDWGNYVISYNYIENIMQTLYDGGGIYTLGDLNGAVISNNYIRNHPAGHGGQIYHDAGSANVEDYDNVLVETTYHLHVTGQQFDPFNINFHDNYADTKNKNQGTYDDTRNIKVDDVTLLEEGNWPQEALDIMENAGLEPAYKRLGVISDMPDWRKNRVNHIPKDWYKSTDTSAGITLEAEDFMEGGEGVAYHKILNPKFDASLYRPQDEVRMYQPADLTSWVVDTNTKGEWLKYELNLDTAGEFFIDVIGKQTFTEFSIAKIYIDDVMVTDNVPMPNINEWNSVTVGPFEMSEGKHQIKVEFISSFYFDKLFLYTKDMLTVSGAKGNEEGYDEGVLVPYGA